MSHDGLGPHSWDSWGYQNCCGGQDPRWRPRPSYLVVLKTLLLLLSPTHHSSHLPANSKPESTHLSLNQVCLSPMSKIKLFPFHYTCLCDQSSLTLCDPVDHSLPSSSVHGIFQARILEWVAIPTPGDLTNPGIKPMFLVFPALAGGFFTNCATWQAFPFD